MIVYFSGTGNSRYCAQMIAAELGDELIDSFAFIRDGIAAELCSERPWIFVSPTYGWQLPRIFADFIRSGSFEGNRTAYFVMTCGSETGDAGAGIELLCAEKGFEYKGLLSVVMPENYVAMFAVPEAEQAERIIERAEPVLRSGIETIAGGGILEGGRVTLIDRLKSGIINRFFYKFCIKAKPFRSTEACISCGKCEQLCPLNSVKIKDGRPVWADKCTHCMACICSCPTEAIEYGSKSRGKPRYQCKEYTR